VRERQGPRNPRAAISANAAGGTVLCLTDTYRLVCTVPMATQTAKQPDVTRDKIVDAAYQEIYWQGFQAASLSNILAKTGLTKGALYHHFPNKNDLGLAVIEEVIREGFEVLVFAPLRESGDPIETLIEIVQKKAGSATLESVSLGCALNNLMQEMSPLDMEFRRSLNGILKDWQDTVSNVLKRAQKQRRVRKDVDGRAAALFIVSAFEGCVGIAKNLQSVKDFGQCMAQLESYIRGLCAKQR